MHSAATDTSNYDYEYSSKDQAVIWPITDYRIPENRPTIDLPVVRVILEARSYLWVF